MFMAESVLRKAYILRGAVAILFLVALSVVWWQSRLPGAQKYVNLKKEGGEVLAEHTSLPVVTSSPEEAKSISGEPLIADARPVVIRKYLERWGSPLVKYSDLIVTASDQNGVDPLLVVAIAQKESNLGKRVISDCYNAWGWAQTSLYTRCFQSWEDGIRKFTQEFSENYIQRGLVTPDQIMTRYNPISPNGAWAKGVVQFLEDLQNLPS